MVQISVPLAMATLSYYLVERRFLALKDTLNDREPRRKPQHARSRSRSGAPPMNTLEA